MALTDYQQLVDSMVRDQSSHLSTGDRDEAIALAVLRYGADAPRELLEDVTWPAAGYTAPLPVGWVQGSYITSAEYPIGEQPVATIDLVAYRTPSGEELMSADAMPLGAVVRIGYSVPHALGGANDTIPSVHREALASYAAHLLCKQLAAYHSSDRDSSINADSSNSDSRARNWAARSREYRAAYYAGIGRVDPQASADVQNQQSKAMGPAASASAWPGRVRSRPALGDSAL